MSAPHAPNALHDALASARLLPAIPPQREAEVRAWADACIATNVPALELLLRGDGAEQAALAAIRNLALSHPALIVGVGSIYDAVAARRLIAAGARFVVSPITDPETGVACREAGVGWLPGAFTPTEIALAERSGATFVKLFPALAIDAPAFLRSVLAPSPNAQIVPTNVSLEEIPPLTAAGAVGFGVGARLLGGAAGDDAAAIAERLRAARSAAGA